MTDVTRILSAMKQGDPHAARELLPLVYDELRKLAAARLAQELPGQTLQATALVHEAYLRLVSHDPDEHWDSRGHFFAAAAEAMRRILVDQARRRNSQRRGGGRQKVDLLAHDLAIDPPDDQILALDEAMTRFHAVDAQAAEVVKLRVFAGMSVEDAARSLGISPRTAKRDWVYARAWLRRQIEGDAGSN